MPLHFAIQTGNAVPIYRQIADAVRLGMATGTLAPGEQLPSVRALAEQLVVNPNTVARAYSDLAREGMIDSQAGRGIFVGKPRQVYTKAERLRRLEPAIDVLVNQAVALNSSLPEVCQAVERRFQELNLTPRPERGHHE